MWSGHCSGIYGDPTKSADSFWFYFAKLVSSVLCFLSLFMCFIAYFIVYAAFVRIKLMTTVLQQEAQLSLRDRAMRRVS